MFHSAIILLFLIICSGEGYFAKQLNHFTIRILDTTVPCQLTKPDTSVFGIHLLNGNSSIKVIGEKYELIEDNIDMPHIRFNSNNNKQVLTLYFHYGGAKNKFSEFQIANNIAKRKNKALKTSEFVTNNKIKLGLTQTQLIKILGECFKSEKSNDKEVFKYRIDDFKNSHFLRVYNYPVYYADYEFTKGRLTRFRFGFEYP